MWATPEEPREGIIAFCRRACDHADTTIETLSLDAPGRVPWWRDENAEVTLHQILVHVVAETHRHAGHADLVRELIDGAAGYRADDSNLPSADSPWWQDYRNRVEQAAQNAAGQ